MNRQESGKLQCLAVICVEVGEDEDVARSRSMIKCGTGVVRERRRKEREEGPDNNEENPPL